MSAEDPSPPASPPEPVQPPPYQAAPAASAPVAVEPRQVGVFVAIGVIVLVLALGAYFVASSSGLLRPGQPALTVAVTPFTPPSPLMSAGDHVMAYAAPDMRSPAVVMFGPGVALNVTGRVSRGLGNEWYAISWNNQTAFVRQQDAVAGEAGPPVTAEHPEQEERVKPDEEEDDEEIIADNEMPPPPPVSQGPLRMGDIDWVRAPSARDFARFYPDRALDQGRSGRVVLDCVAGSSGALDCSVSEESPIGYGFGDAAVSISRQLRIQPTTPDWRSVAGSSIRLPLAFRAG